jgi:hypothetical protein
MKAKITPVKLTGGTPKARTMPDGSSARASRKEYRAYLRKHKKGAINNESTD